MPRSIEILSGIRVFATIVSFIAGIVASVASEAESPEFAVDTAIRILDTDGDKMPDVWESANGLSNLANDTLGNPDGDYLNNLAEYNAGTHPQVPDFAATKFDVSELFILSLRPLASDLDGDGMPDVWETANGLNSGANDSALDFDLDGLSNLTEYNSGWNPRVKEVLATLSGQSALFITSTGGYLAGFTYDGDSDGMPDWWETLYSLDLAMNDGALDPDTDGLSNLQEYRTGYNPNQRDVNGETFEVSSLFVGNFAGRLPDTDHDGMPDIWESASGTNPAVADAPADPDSDGQSNLAEYNAGTNPLVDDWRGPAILTSGSFLADTGGFNGGFSPDSDHDNMPDWWEIKYGLNPLTADANGNLDIDALTNLQEYNAGSDPSRFGFLILVDAEGNIFTCDTGGAFIDTDSDGIPDWWERHNGGNRTAMNPTSDSDGDGKNNLAEYVAGMDPLDSNSSFEVSKTEMTLDEQGSLFRVSWRTVQGRRYKIYSSEVLANTWPTIPVVTVIGDGTEQTCSIRPEGKAKLFVRIEVEVITP